MKKKIISFVTYSATIISTTFLMIIIGAELITQYKMYTEGYTGIERHHLADDMGFGLLLMLGLIPELLIGIVCGFFIGRKINDKINRT